MELFVGFLTGVIGGVYASWVMAAKERDKDRKKKEESGTASEQARESWLRRRGAK